MRLIDIFCILRRNNIGKIVNSIGQMKRSRRKPIRERYKRDRQRVNSEGLLDRCYESFANNICTIVFREFSECMSMHAGTASYYKSDEL